MERVSAAVLTVVILGVVVIVAGIFATAACEDADRREAQREMRRSLPTPTAAPISPQRRDMPRPTPARTLPTQPPISARVLATRASVGSTPTPSPTPVRVALTTTSRPLPTPTPFRVPPTVTPRPEPTPTAARPASAVAHVVRVVDGDTLDVRVSGYRERVRLLKVDTPERGCPWFEAATEFVRERVEGKQVALRFPSGTPEWDVYGRLLAEVLFQRGGRVFDLGHELLEAGLAMPYVRGGPDCLPPG